MGTEQVAPTWRAYGRLPRIIKARVKAYQNLSGDCQFPWDAKNFTIMLIAHAKRYVGCFTASRRNLDKLGFDTATLDGICANPDQLSLKERDRLFVHYALKIATSSARPEAQRLQGDGGTWLFER